MPSSISTSLLTDMYELTMFDAALKAGTAWRTSTFEVFGRRLPATRRFGVVAGTGRILEALERFEFEPAQIDALHRFDSRLCRRRMLFPRLPSADRRGDLRRVHDARDASSVDSEP